MKFIYVLIPLLTVVTVTFVAISYAAPTTTQVSNPLLGASSLDDRPINMQLGNGEYAIPQNYFDLLPDPSCNARSALFRVLYPEITPRTQENREEFYRVGASNRAGNILLRFHRGERLPDYPIDGALKRVLDVKLSNLHPYTVTRGYTLHRASAYDYKHKWYKYHIYYDRLNDPQIIAECSIPKDKDTPQCSLSFYHGELEVKSSFPRTLLSQWPRIASNVKQTLDRFYVGPADALKPYCNDTF